MKYLIFLITILLAFVPEPISARDDTIYDSLAVRYSDDKNINKIKSKTYDINNTIKSIFKQDIDLPEMINYIYEAEIGDNLDKIASKLAVSKTKIREWNNLEEGLSNIYAGQKLTIWIPNDSSNVSLTHFGKRQILHNAMTEKPNLFYKKDEFESSFEYGLRKEKQREFISLYENNLVAEALIAKLKQKQKDEADLRKKLLEKEKKIVSSLSLVEGQLVAVGNYNADTEMFDSVLVSFKTTYIYEDVKVFGYGSRLYGTIGETRFGSKYFQNFMEVNLYGSINGATMRLPHDMINKVTKPEILYVKEESLGAAISPEIQKKIDFWIRWNVIFGVLLVLSIIIEPESAFESIIGTGIMFMAPAIVRILFLRKKSPKSPDDKIHKIFSTSLQASLKDCIDKLNKKVKENSLSFDLNQFIDYMKESTQIGTELDEIKFQLENHNKVLSDDETLADEIKRNLSAITDRLVLLNVAGN